MSLRLLNLGELLDSRDYVYNVKSKVRRLSMSELEKNKCKLEVRFSNILLLIEIAIVECSDALNLC